MTATERDLLDTVLRWLEPIAEPAAKDSEPSRWIAARNADPDQASNWCTHCATKEVARLNALHPDHEYIVDGGWSTTTDVPPICEGCGKSLVGVFTEHAIEYETEHYLAHRLTLRGRFRHERAFRLTQVLESGDFDLSNKDHAALFRKLDRMRRRADGVATLPSTKADQQEEPK